MVLGGRRKERLLRRAEGGGEGGGGCECAGGGKAADQCWERNVKAGEGALGWTGGQWRREGGGVAWSTDWPARSRSETTATQINRLRKGRAGGMCADLLAMPRVWRNGNALICMTSVIRCACPSAICVQSVPPPNVHSIRCKTSVTRVQRVGPLFDLRINGLAAFGRLFPSVSRCVFADNEHRQRGRPASNFDSMRALALHCIAIRSVRDDPPSILMEKAPHSHTQRPAFHARCRRADATGHYKTVSACPRLVSSFLFPTHALNSLTDLPRFNLSRLCSFFPPPLSPPFYHLPTPYSKWLA